MHQRRKPRKFKMDENFIQLFTLIEEKGKIGVERNQQFTTKNNVQSLPAFASTSTKESQGSKRNVSSVATR